MKVRTLCSSAAIHYEDVCPRLPSSTPAAAVILDVNWISCKSIQWVFKHFTDINHMVALQETSGHKPASVLVVTKSSPCLTLQSYQFILDCSVSSTSRAFRREWHQQEPTWRLCWLAVVALLALWHWVTETSHGSRTAARLTVTSSDTTVLLLLRPQTSQQRWFSSRKQSSDSHQPHPGCSPRGHFHQTLNPGVSIYIRNCVLFLNEALVFLNSKQMWCWNICTLQIIHFIFRFFWTIAERTLDVFTVVHAEESLSDNQLWKWLKKNWLID